MLHPLPVSAILMPNAEILSIKLPPGPIKLCTSPDGMDIVESKDATTYTGGDIQGIFSSLASQANSSSSNGENNDEPPIDLFGGKESDLNKGITSITYNHLDLPMKITFGTTGYIEYLYDAAGTKLQRRVSGKPLTSADMSGVYVTDYLGGFQYTDGKLGFFPTSEGYVRATGKSKSPYNYVFNYTDHLGNVRVSYGIDADSTIKIMEENNYYPFGLRHRNYNMTKLDYDENGMFVDVPVSAVSVYKYKFNGKELQDELGLNVYDYDNRIYDPATGRFLQMDPKGELGRRWSSYNYCFDNPMYFRDPDGMWPWPTWSSVKSFTKGFATTLAGMSQGANPINQAIGVARTTWDVGKSVAKGDFKGAGNKLVESTGIPAAINTVKKARSGDAEAIGNVTAVVVAAIVVHKAGGSGAAAGEAAGAETKTLYRGVNSTSPVYEGATQGSAAPKGGNATAAEHNAGNTNSEFTSWTTNAEVAKNYALRTSGEGVVMETTVPTSSTVASPSLKDVVLKQGGGMVNESEVLLKGPVSGATVSPIRQ